LTIVTGGLLHELVPSITSLTRGVAHGSGSPQDAWPAARLTAVVEQRSGLLPVQELIEITGFGKMPIYDMVAKGWIPYLRFGSSIRFDPIAIASWMREQTVPMAA